MVKAEFSFCIIKHHTFQFYGALTLQNSISVSVDADCRFYCPLYTRLRPLLLALTGFVVTQENISLLFGNPSFHLDCHSAVSKAQS